jgi:hypothetical protein
MARRRQITLQPQAMIGTERFVNVRGYVVQVTVDHKNEESGEWIVKTRSGRRESVPEHLFYHQSGSGLVMRGQEDFIRRYPDHPIEIMKVSS